MRQKTHSKKIFLLMILFAMLGIAVNVNPHPSIGFLYPAPMLLERGTGEFSVNKEMVIVFDEMSKGNAVTLHQELLDGIGLKLMLNKTDQLAHKSNMIVLNIAKGRNHNVIKTTVGAKPESGLLFVANNHILINGTDPGGQLYGVIGFLQAIDVERRSIPCVEISYRPKMSFRGVRGHLPKNTPGQIENFKLIIRAMAFCRLNQLWSRDLYVRRIPASVRWDFHPEIRDEDALPKAIVKELIAYAEKYNVKLMGSLASTADNVWSVYPHLIEMQANESPFTVGVKAEKEKGRTSKYRFGSRFNLCPSKGETYRLLFDLIDEMAPLFTSEFFNLGIDEVDQDYNGSRWVACNHCSG